MYIIVMIIKRVIAPESVHRNGYNDTLGGIKYQERIHHIPFLIRLSMVFICFILLLGSISLCIGKAEAVTTSGWESEKEVIRGLPEHIYIAYPSIAFDVMGDGNIFLISGDGYGHWFGYYWNGKRWFSDVSRVTGLKKENIGLNLAPAMAFNLTGDGKWTLIVRNSVGNFYGYYWNGMQWLSDSSRVAGLDVIPGMAGITILDNLTGDGRETLITGNDEGTFNGYYWNGTQWISDISRVNGLENVGSHSSVTSRFNVFADRKWTLITGNREGTFSGYYWEGAQWISDPSKVNGLGDIGTHSTPAMVYNLLDNGKWVLITGTGSSSGFSDFDGFFYNIVKIEELSSIADVAFYNPRATTVHINWTYDQTWNHKVKYSTYPDMSDALWSDWQNDTDNVDIKLRNLLPDATYYYEAYTYVPWNRSYYVNSSVNTFTTISGQDHIYVNPGDSIQDAIDTLLPEGGTAELLPGVHNVYDTIVISRNNVTIQGTHDSEIRSHDPSEHIFVIPHENPRGAEDWENMPKLENFVFKGFKVNSTYVYGEGNRFVSVWNVNNVTIEDILGVSHIPHFICINPTGGSTTARSRGIFVRNNTIYYSRITIYYSENIHILNNTLEGRNANICIFRNNKYIHVIGNRVINHGGSLFACLLMEGVGWVVYDNVFEGNRVGIRLTISPSNVIVRNNTVTGATVAGIRFHCQFGMRNITIANNRVYNNKGHGILTTELPKASRYTEANITNNVIYNNSGDGVRMTTDCAALNMFNNIITNNTGYGINHMAGNISHSYNNVWDNTLGSYNNTTAGTGEISEDPLFVDAANYDLHLKSTGGHWNGSTWVYGNVTSPCIDAGDPASEYGNEPEPNGGRINMGAYGNTGEASKSPPPALLHNGRSKYKNLNGLLYSNCLYVPPIVYTTFYRN
jgi:parallel beta-helix repeat protein